MLQPRIGTLLSLVIAASLASALPAIDGVIDPGEWDAYYLGTSVTGWQGGMSVDVYGFATATDLYAAYVADTGQPGWGVAQALNIPSNFYFKTPLSGSWPDPGYTIVSLYGDGFGQTDGSDWAFPDGWGNGDWAGRGIEYSHFPAGYGDPTENVAELKVPLSQLTYAGTEGTIALGGQYWQYDWAEPFAVTLPTTAVPEPGSLAVLGLGLLGCVRRRRAGRTRR